MSHWVAKFLVAWMGMIHSARTQPTYWVHLSVAILVVCLGVWLKIERWQWVVLAGSIGFVCAMETINTAIEQLVRALHPEHDPKVGLALDIAAGSVLVSAITAIVLGVITLLPELLAKLGFPFGI